MDAHVTRDVTELGDSDRQSLEHLLGTPLSGSQKICIVIFSPDKEPDSETRHAVAVILTSFSTRLQTIPKRTMSATPISTKR